MNTLLMILVRVMIICSEINITGRGITGVHFISNSAKIELLFLMILYLLKKILVLPLLKNMLLV